MLDIFGFSSFFLVLSLICTRKTVLRLLSQATLSPFTHDHSTLELTCLTAWVYLKGTKAYVNKCFGKVELQINKDSMVLNEICSVRGVL